MRGVVAHGHLGRHTLGLERRQGGGEGALRRVEAQRRLEDLADAGQRHLRDRHHLHRHGGAFGDFLAAELAQLVGCHLGAGLELHEGHRHLAGVAVGQADRRGDLDRGMAHQRLLDDDRVDVVAAADDQVLRAPGEPEVAVLVEPAEIARVEPAVGQHRALVVARVEIAWRHLRAPHQHVTDRARRAVAADRAAP